MEEDGVSREYVGSGEDEESLEESIESMTDESVSIIRASDSDCSSIATRCSALGRGESPQLTWSQCRHTETGGVGFKLQTHVFPTLSPSTLFYWPSLY